MSERITPRTRRDDFVFFNLHRFQLRLRSHGALQNHLHPRLDHDVARGETALAPALPSGLA